MNSILSDRTSHERPSSEFRQMPHDLQSPEELVSSSLAIGRHGICFPRPRPKTAIGGASVPFPLGKASVTLLTSVRGGLSGLLRYACKNFRSPSLEQRFPIEYNVKTYVIRDVSHASAAWGKTTRRPVAMHFRSRILLNVVAISTQSWDSVHSGLYVGRPVSSSGLPKVVSSVACGHERREGRGILSG